MVRAVVMRGGALTVEELPDPIPGPGQVLVAPRATGICGSDLHAREGLAELAEAMPDAVAPIVPGHEVAGLVVAVGPDTPTSLREGDLVTAIPFTPGPSGFEAIGLSPVAAGGLADLTLFDEVRTFRLPDGVDARLGALGEPVAVAVHAFALAAPRGPIAVVGTGPIGLAIVAVAAASGRGPIVAVDPSPTRRAMAAALGADAVHEPGTSLSDLLDEVGFRPSPISPLLDGDATSATVFECVGRPDIVQDVVAQAPAHGRVVLAGACMHPIEVDPLTLTLHEVSVVAAFAYRPHDFARALALLADRPQVFARLITSDRSLDATESAFDDLARDPSELKILIHPDQP